MSDKRYCLQCGAELIVRALERNPLSIGIGWDPVCANCGSKDYDKPISSNGINMILAGRVKSLELELERCKICSRLDSDTRNMAIDSSKRMQALAEDIIKQKDSYYSALICTRSALDINANEAARDYARMLADRILGKT